MFINAGIGFELNRDDSKKRPAARMRRRSVSLDQLPLHPTHRFTFCKVSNCAIRWFSSEGSEGPNVGCRRERDSYEPDWVRCRTSRSEDRHSLVELITFSRKRNRRLSESNDAEKQSEGDCQIRIALHSIGRRPTERPPSQRPIV